MNFLASTIQHVTLFPDQAEVIRHTELISSSEEEEWIIGPFSQQLRKDSLQVQLRGAATLLEVSVFKPIIKPELDKTMVAHKEELRKLHLEKERLQDQLEGFQRRLDLVEGMVSQSGSGQNEHKPAFEPGQWKQILDFYDAEHAQHAQASGPIQEQLTDILEKIKQLEQALAQPRLRAQAFPYAAKIRVRHTDEQPVICEISYLIKGASWRPKYDIRVDTDAQTAELQYQAWVEQKTGEDWEDVQLALSTARPTMAGNVPDLSPVYLRKHVPVPQKPMPMARSAAVGGASPKVKRSRSVKSAAPPMQEMAMAAPEPAPRPQAQVSQQATAVQFDIEALQSVPNGGEGQQVFILEQAVGLELKYKTVPAMQAKAFLRAHIHNNTGVPMLPGQAHVFMDGRFVAAQTLKLVAPQDKFWCSLGIDSGIKVEQEFVKGKRSSEGFLGPKKEKYQSEFRFKLTNFKSKSVQIEVQARYPVSQDEDIKVELIEPKYQEDSAALKKDEKNRLTWSLILDPEVERKITLAYSVTHPKGMQVDQWS